MPWDAETLKEYVDSRFDARNEASGLQQADLARRFDNINELRGMVTDQAARFLTVELYNINHRSLEDKIDLLAKNVSDTDKAQASLPGRFDGKMNQVLVAILVAAVTVALSFFFTHYLVPTSIK